MDGVNYIQNFVAAPGAMFNYLKQSVIWDERMSVRKTASYGVAYNYSQMSYPYQRMPALLSELCNDVNRAIGFEPNNCLINYYLDGKSQMGFHADQTDILEKDTGIVIVSLGEARILRFRNIADKGQIADYELVPGSLLYMTQTLQQSWEHAIPKSGTDKGRMSLTFRKII